MRIFIIIFILLSSLCSIGQRQITLGQPNLHYYRPYLKLDTLKSTTIYQTANDSAGTATGGFVFRDAATGKYRITAGSSGSGVTTMAAIGSSPNANGASISGSTLTLQPASGSFGGVVTTGTQTFAGDKTFSNDILIHNVLAGNGPGGHNSNTRMGTDALLINSGDNGNSAFGHESLRSDIGGYFNTGFGRQTLFSLSAGHSNSALGHGAGYNATGNGNIFLGNSAGYNQTTGDDKLWISNSASNNLMYGDFSNGRLIINAGASPSDNGVGTLQVRGKLTVDEHTIAANSDSAVIRDPSNGEYKYARINGIGSTTLYSGDGTLAGNRTVTGSNNSITFDDIFAFRINSDYNVIAKANATGTYSEAVAGAPNHYWLGYTPTPGVFSKGAGILIDTNNNVGLGTTPPTTMPLYSTGSSVFVQGFQSNLGNFYKVSNQTADFTASLSAYFYTIDATSGNVTVTLPAASTAFGNTMGITYKFQRIDNSGNTVTVQRAGSDTVNGTTSFTLTSQYQVKQVQCTSTSTWAQW